jgi:hypothetical protein
VAGSGGSRVESTIVFTTPVMTSPNTVYASVIVVWTVATTFVTVSVVISLMVRLSVSLVYYPEN